MKFDAQKMFECWAKEADDGNCQEAYDLLVHMLIHEWRHRSSHMSRKDEKAVKRLVMGYARPSDADAFEKEWETHVSW